MKKMVALLLVAVMLCSATVAMATMTMGQDPATSTDLTWYADNSVCALGLSLRDDLGLSDKWYNVVPVSLAEDGTQTIDLVAANLFCFGTATITVANGEVTVDYKLPMIEAYVKDECLQWFTSLDQITPEFLANPVGEYAFGEPVSISEKLGGHSIALLFIRNRVTFRQPGDADAVGLTRYYPNLDQWKNWREQLFELLRAMEAEQTEESAAPVTTEPEQNEATESDLNVATDSDLNGAATETDLAGDAA